MDRGIYVAAAGGVNSSSGMEIITNNIAGSSVTGFKKDVPVFSVYQTTAETANSAGQISGEKVFVNMQEVLTDFSQGIVKNSGGQLDAAIIGDGFFAVQGPQGRLYTRRGDFVLDAEGRLMTANGYLVEGDGGVITLTAGEVAIAQDGTISVNNEQIDKLKVVDFPKPYKLRKAGEGMFMAEAGVNEAEPESISIAQRHIEVSNVNAVKEMVSMLTALRAYESNMKLINSFDDITQMAIKAGRG